MRVPKAIFQFSFFAIFTASCASRTISVSEIPFDDTTKILKTSLDSSYFKLITSSRKNGRTADTSSLLIGIEFNSAMQHFLLKNQNGIIRYLDHDSLCNEAQNAIKNRGNNSSVTALDYFKRDSLGGYTVVLVRDRKIPWTKGVGKDTTY